MLGSTKILATPLFTEEIVTECKTMSDAIGIDRNDCCANLSEGYFHNFDIPDNTSLCGDAEVTSALVEITLNSITNTLPAGCSFYNVFGNVFIDPPSYAAYSSTIFTDIMTVGCSNFGGGSQALTTFSNEIVSTCAAVLTPGGVLGVDVVPAVFYDPGNCAHSQSAITDGVMIVDYEVCVTFTVNSPEAPTADAGPDVTIQCGESALIGADPVTVDAEDDWTYEWSNGPDGTFETENGQITVFTFTTTTYTVTVVGDGGCEATDDVEVVYDPSNDPMCNTDICAGDTETIDPFSPCNCIVDEVQVLGCMDPSSCNYNSMANCDDGSCLVAPVCNTDICAGDTEIINPLDPCDCIIDQVQVVGCTNPTSCNYDPTANCDNGSCIAAPVCNMDICAGDTEMIDPLDPCNCIIDQVQVLGCTDPTSCNYDLLANCDNGTCIPSPVCNTNICLGDTEIIDPLDPCNCIIDEIRVFGCTNPIACNYNPLANCDDGSCLPNPVCNTNICAGDTEMIDPLDLCNCIIDEIQVLGCTDPTACNYNSSANCDDGSCLPVPLCNIDICLGDTEVIDPLDACTCIVDVIQVLGCTNPAADNYDPLANCDDGSCNCVPDGCTNSASCNYDPLATCDDGSCLPAPTCNADICLGDTEIVDPLDACSCIVDVIQVFGCTNPAADNYDPLANCDDGSCSCIPDGCTDPTSCNFDPLATCDDGSCLPAPTCNTDICLGDTEIVNPLDVCSCIVDEIQVLGCTNPAADNYDPLANCDDGSCNCIPDGCTDPTSCNFDPLATCDDGTCLPVPTCNTDICSGDTEVVDPSNACNCIVDEIQVLGCTNAAASNYNPLANCDDGSCDCIPDGCTNSASCNYDPLATCDDGSCLPAPVCNMDICLGNTEIIDPANPCNCIVDEIQVLGCTNPAASNYNALANCDDGSCDCIPDGCTNPTSCNYDPLATCDDGSCLPMPSCNTDICLGDTEVLDPSDPCNCIVDEIQVLGCTNAAASNYNALANCDDGSCDCIPDGCTNPASCNYDPLATCDDGSCLPTPSCNTDICIGDTEIIDPSDPCSCIVDIVQVLGCTDPNGCNYDANANCDDGSCISNEDPGTCNSDCLVGDIEIWDPLSCTCIVDVISVLGCTDPLALNYDPTATCDDGSCSFNCDAIAMAGSDFEFPCAGFFSMLNANGSSMGTNYTYEWTTINGTIESGANTLAPVVTGAGEYILTVYNIDQDCSVTDGVIVTIGNMGPQSIAEQNIQSVCEGETNGVIEINTISGGMAPYEFTLLQTGDTNNTGLFSGLESGIYQVLIYDNFGCELIVDIEVPIFDMVNLSVETTTTSIQFGESLNGELITNIDASLIDSIVWSPNAFVDCQDCLNQVFSPESTTTFVATLYDINGCSTTASIEIEVDVSQDIFIGNIFSPTGDADYIYIQGRQNLGTIDRMAIYDRWGNEVFLNENFEANIPTEGWDGTINGQNAMTGVYVYYVVIKDALGNDEILVGDITLIR